jgi:signal transduction histidine kinase
VSAVDALWRQHLLEIGGFGVLATAALLLAVLATQRQVHRLIAEQIRRIAIEQAARNGQKLELLGQFAAGIAHDFANILQAMGMLATSLQHRATQPERVRALAERLGEDVERGTSLIQRMLDLVRQNRWLAEDRPSQASGVLDAAEVMTRVSEMLPRLLGSRYQLRCEVPKRRVARVSWHHPSGQRLRQ